MGDIGTERGFDLLSGSPLYHPTPKREHIVDIILPGSDII